MDGQQAAGRVVSVSSSDNHSMSKPTSDCIKLIAGYGVDGDAHGGQTVKHRSRVARDPTQPNLRQVHLIHAELHEELRQRGFNAQAGWMGENITTEGIDLLELGTDTLLKVGEEAVIRVTGLRNPCAQLDGLQPGLMQAVLDRDSDGNPVRRAGIMGVVEATGSVKPGDPIVVSLPSSDHRPLIPV